MDTNGDGVVDELDDQLATATDTSQQMDTNGDGVVDEQDNATTEAVPGDTNGDGVVDELDAETTTEATDAGIDAETATNTSSTDETQMDTNGDGVVDEQDTATTEAVPGDTNGDGVVDEQDTATTEAVPGDTNGDGVVDEQDTATTEAVPGDTNGDGVVDEQDTIAGDTNGDGVVDASDAATTTDATNASSTDEIQMDTNGDGVVDELDETTATDATNASSTDEIQMDTNGDGVVDDQDTGTTTAEKQPTATDLEDLTDPDQKQPSAQKAPTTAPAPTQPTTAPAPTQPTTAPAPTQPTTAPAPTQPTTAPAQKAPTATKVDTKDQLSKEKIICNPAEQLLVKDSSGNAVRVLQTILTQMGYDPKTIDGKFGPNTEKAVIQFQEINGLVKDGKVGKNTWTKLCALYKQTKTTTLEDLIGGGDKAGGGVVPVRENEVCKITKLDLKSGDIGDDIVILQKNLKELGYYPYGVDLTVKKFGPQTEMSVRLFQISNKVPVTGIVDKITHEKICAASTDKNKNRQLILNNFVKNPNASTLDLLKGGQAFKQFKWHAADYLGNPVGPNEKETLKLVNQLNNIILEDRVNRQANAILIDSEYQKDKTGYNEYFKKNVKPIPDYPKHLLNKYALDSFVKMRQAAKGEGIEIVPLSTYRDPVADAKRAEEANNPNAIAKGISPHGLGVAIDIKMSDGNKNYKEITTYPFSNIMDMRSSSIYKWLVIFANDFNFHPFNQEPWHWEYNYKNFKPVYLSEFKK